MNRPNYFLGAQMAAVGSLRLVVPGGCPELKKFYCLQQGTSKRGEGRPFFSCRGYKTA